MQMLKLFPAAHPDGKVTCVAVDPAHNQIFVAAQSPNIYVWSTTSHSSQPVTVMKGHSGAVTGLVYFTGMGLVISSSLDGTCIIWDDRFKVLQVGARSLAQLLLYRRLQLSEPWDATTGAQSAEADSMPGLEPEADNPRHRTKPNNAVLQDD